MDPDVRTMLNTMDTQAVRRWLHETSLANVEEYLHEMSADNAFRRMALAERERRYFRELKRPHWTVTPTFWVALVGSLAAIAAAIISWFAWQHPH